MKSLRSFSVAPLLLAAFLAAPAAAQDLVLTNARVLDGRGGSIERGTVVVSGGKIVSVSAGAPSGARGQVIDVKGMTVLPGFIDSHRHPIGGGADWIKSEAPARMREFLEAGFTTVLSAGDDVTTATELRKQLASGAIRGPRLLVLGRVPTAGAAGGGRGAAPAAAPAGRGAADAGRGAADGGRGAADAGRGGAQPGRAAGDGGRGAAPAGRGAGRGDPARNVALRTPPATPPAAIPAEQTRASVAALAKAGVDGIKTVIQVTDGGPEAATQKLIVEEAKKYNLPVMTHAVSVADTMAAVEAGVQTLAHTPHIGQLTLEQAQTIAKSGIPMMSTLGVFVPFFDEKDQALFRDRLPFPWETLSSGGQGPVNARLVAEAGTTYGFGTDTSWLPRDGLALELRPLALVFSPKQIVSILTRNAAVAVHKANEIGTLEAGKLADIVVLNGDPHANVSNLLNVTMVIRGGQVVVDKR